MCLPKPRSNRPNHRDSGYHTAISPTALSPVHPQISSIDAEATLEARRGGTDIRRADLAAYDESQGFAHGDRRLRWLQRNQAMVRPFAIRDVESDIVRHLN